MAVIVATTNISEGFRQQVSLELGADRNLITIRSGRAVTRNHQGRIESYNFDQALRANPILTARDLTLVESLPTTVKTAPVVNLDSQIKSITGRVFDGHVLASNQHLLDLTNQTLASGSTFQD